MAKQFINIPTKVLTGRVLTVTGKDFWPYDNGHDPYWQFGTSPKYFRWTVELEVSTQNHSSPDTRQPYQFNGMDAHIGDYVADVTSGVALKIVEITSKGTASLICVLEDVFRYNTYRDATGTATGIFPVDTNIVLFELNESAMPLIDPVPDLVNNSFFTNLNSRFQNLEQLYNFILEKDAHGFQIGDVVAADPSTNSFVLANSGHTNLIGTVSDLILGPNAFCVNPFSKIVDNFNFLIGEVGDVIYADPINAGDYSLVGTQPIFIKVRQQSNTVVNGTAVSPTTSAGSVLSMNGQQITFGVGDTDDFIDSCNLFTAQTGVVASSYSASTVAEPTSAPVGFLQVPASATINGVTVNFTTYASGELAFGVPGYSDMNDIATDINAASIPGLTAVVFNGTFGTSVRLTVASGGIDIVNITNDGMGNPVAGPSSCTGLPLSTAESTDEMVRLSAVDARPIELLDIMGSPSFDFGLVSSENGQKAAAMVVEQGIRQAATYVVANIAARDALDALPGDQAYVIDQGNSEWAFFIYTLDSVWVQTADKDSSETDAQSVEVVVTNASAASGAIHTISEGRRVSFVTVTVTEAFDGAASITVGDDNDNDRLMTDEQNDLESVGDYSTTPSHTYSGAGDTTIKFYFDAAGATVGSAIIAITYT